MEIVGEGGTDVGGEADHDKPGLLRPGRHGLGNAKGVARKDTTDIDLVVRKVGEAVIAVARHQVPLCAKVVIQAGSEEVAALWEQDVGFVADDVDAIADRARERTAAFVKGAHVGACRSIIPNRRLWQLRLVERSECRVHTNVPGIGSRQLSSGVCIGAKSQLTLLQKLIRWDCPLVGSGRRVTEPFVVGEEVGPATPDSGCDGSAGSGAEAVEVIAGLRSVSVREVVLPGVGADVVVQVVLVDGSMHRIVTAFGDDL